MTFPWFLIESKIIYKKNDSHTTVGASEPEGHLYIEYIGLFVVVKQFIHTYKRFRRGFIYLSTNIYSF